MPSGDAPTAKLERERCVRFSLLAHLIASGPKASSWRKELRPGLATAGGHLALVAAFLFVLPARPAPDSLSETVTYLDVPPPPAAESPRTMLPPPPPVVRQGLRIPAVLPEVAQPGMLAGFQELLAPERLAGLPPPDLGQQFVSELDFKGRGVAGGVAGGVKPEEVPAPTDSTPVAMTPWYATAAVDEPPVLLNRAEIPRIVRDLYPAPLRQFHVGGDVRVEFVVDAAGGVDAASVRVLTSPHPLLASATHAALKAFRFRPARMTIGDEMRIVAVRVVMSIVWTVNEGGTR